MKFCPFCKKENYTKEYNRKPDQYNTKQLCNVVIDDADLSSKS